MFALQYAEHGREKRIILLPEVAKAPSDSAVSLHGPVIPLQTQNRILTAAAFILLAWDSLPGFSPSLLFLEYLQSPLLF